MTQQLQNSLNILAGIRFSWEGTRHIACWMVSDGQSVGEMSLVGVPSCSPGRVLWGCGGYDDPTLL